MLERLSRLAFLGKSLNFIKKSIFLRLVMNADMIPGMAYEPHGFKFKMRCLKGIILDSGKLVHPVDGPQVGYIQAAKECISLNLELVEPESRYENEQINNYLVENQFFLGVFSKRCKFLHWVPTDYLFYD